MKAWIWRLRCASCLPASVVAATETFDAGGMFGPIRLGAELTNACVVGMQVVGGSPAGRLRVHGLTGFVVGHFGQLLRSRWRA